MFLRFLSTEHEDERILGNQKILSLKIACGYSLAPSLPTKTRNLAKALQNWVKLTTSLSIKILLNSILQTGLKIFRKGLSEKINFTFTIGPDSLEFSILTTFSTLNVFFVVEIDIKSNGDAIVTFDLFRKFYPARSFEVQVLH